MRSIYLLLCMALAVCGCRSCIGGAQEKPDGSVKESTPLPDPVEQQETSAETHLEPVRVRQSQLDGKLDDGNKYPFSVLVEANVFLAEVGEFQCSGVLIAPSVVLTAGHCVCLPHEEETDGGGGRTVVDGASCASNATVMTMLYQTVAQGARPRAVLERHQGKVRVHPELKLMLDDRGRAVTVHANLAVVFLNEVLSGDFSPVGLTDSDVQPNEILVTVGYGSRPGFPELFGQRRSNRQRIARMSENHEQLFLEPSRPPFYENDAGGPCLRETQQGVTLAGISNRGMSSEPLCINAYRYKGWLSEQVQEARGFK